MTQLRYNYFVEYEWDEIIKDLSDSDETLTSTAPDYRRPGFKLEITFKLKFSNQTRSNRLREIEPNKLFINQYLTMELYETYSGHSG